jgi:hypothetical protein
VALSNNTLEQLYALTVLTPIVGEQLPTLQTALAGLSQPSPFARLGATHFARFVIVPNRSDAGAPAVEALPSPYLLFSATFDGAAAGPYLDDLCQELAAEAEQIWGCCEGAPVPARGAALKNYLEHNQIPTGLFFAAYPEADVATVRAALGTRTKMISLAIRGQAMASEDLRQAFFEEFPR